MDEALLNVLRQSHIFAALEEAELRVLFERARPRSYQGGQVLFKEGEPGDALVVLVRGWAVLTRSTPAGRLIQIGRAGPGEVLGEMALLDAAPRSATATVLVPVVAYEIPRARFEALLDVLEPAAVKLLQQLNQVLCFRLRSVLNRIESEILEDKAPYRAAPVLPGGRHRRGAYSSDLLTTAGMMQPFPEEPRDTSGAEPAGAGDEPDEETLTTGSIEAPTFELARRGGIWKILWGVRG